MNPHQVLSDAYMGVGFNPVKEDRELGIEFDNVEVLNKIASEIKFDRSLGMNATMIRLSRTVSA